MIKSSNRLIISKHLILIGVLILSFLRVNAVETGFRSHVDYEYLRGIEEFRGANLHGVSVTLGYQVSERCFFGVGTGYQFFSFHKMDRKTHYNVPIYGDCRVFFGDYSTAFIDIKMGASVGGIGNGFYTNPSAGYHFQLGDSYGLNLAIGYSFMIGKSSLVKGNTFNMSGVNFKIGFDI